MGRVHQRLTPHRHLSDKPRALCCLFQQPQTKPSKAHLESSVVLQLRKEGWDEAAVARREGRKEGRKERVCSCICLFLLASLCSPLLFSSLFLSLSFLFRLCLVFYSVACVEEGILSWPPPSCSLPGHLCWQLGSAPPLRGQGLSRPPLTAPTSL